MALAGKVDACNSFLGSERECGEEMIASGDFGHTFARFLGTWFFFRPLPNGMPLMASVVRLG